MNRNDDSFLHYCKIHCKTERALFSGVDAQRIYTLAGTPVIFSEDEFYDIHEDEMLPLVQRAWDRIETRRNQEPLPWDGFPLGEH